MISTHKGFFVVICCVLALAGICIGCGGDDTASPRPEPEPEPEPVPTEKINGVVILPEGWGGNLSDLRVVDVIEGTTCNADSSFVLPVFENQKQLALVLGPEDGLVLLGWLGRDSTELSTRSTAEFLAWLGVGAWMTPGDTQQEIRRLLADPALDLGDLEAAWTAMLTDQANGLSGEHQDLHQALQAVVDQLIPPQEKGVIIEPGAQQSGIDVLNQGGINKITIQNSYRRRAAGFLWRLGYQDTNMVPQMLDEPELVEEFEIPPVEAFGGTLNTIQGYVTGGLAYEPLMMDPMLLTWHDDARRDYYRVNVLGMARHEADNPELYSSYELAQGEWMALKCMVLDYFLPMFMNLAGVATTVADEIFDDEIPGQVNDFISLVGETFPEFYQQTTEGQFWPALHTIWDTALNNGTLQGWTFDLIEDGLQAARFTAGETAEVMGAVDKLFLYLGIVDIIGGFGDNIITAHHFDLCKKAESWDLTVTSPVIHIEPREVEIQPFDTQLLTLVVDDDTGEYPEGWAYAYHWTCTGRHGTMVNPEDYTDSSNDFLTSSGFVQYIADDGSEGEDLFSCRLFITLGGEQTFIKAASARIEVVNQHIVLADTLKSCPHGTIEMRPTLDPPHDGEGTIVWTWSSPELTGVLRGPSGQGPPWTSTDNFAKFLMNYEGGDDYVTCIASIDYGEDVISPVDTVEVFIEDIGEFEPYQGEHFCYSWFTVHDSGRCTEGQRVAIRFDVIPGVLMYDIHGEGFNDPYYYGTEYNLRIRTQYLDYWGDQAFIGLTSGGGHVDCDNPTPEDELCAFGLSRFEGAVWTISPVCP